jgi:hypothetical protein
MDTVPLSAMDTLQFSPMDTLQLSTMDTVPLSTMDTLHSLQSLFTWDGVDGFKIYESFYITGKFRAQYQECLFLLFPLKKNIDR